MLSKLTFQNYVNNIRNHIITYIVNVLFNKWYDMKKTFAISKYFRISRALLYKVNRQ